MGNQCISIHIFLKTTASPKCRHLFAFDFTVTPLKGITSKAASVPETANDWESVLEKALAHVGPSYQFFPDPDVVEKDTAYMSQDSIKRALSSPL